MSVATLNGSVVTKSYPVQVHFEWGTTIFYGNTTPAQFIAVNTVPTSFSANLTGLSDSTNYHYRSVAVYPLGTVYSPDQSFTTPSCGGEPDVIVVATTPSAWEFEGVPGVFTVFRTGSTASPLTVNFLLSGTAVEGVDYDPIGVSVIIPAGEPSVNVFVNPIDNLTFGPDLTVTITLQASINYNIDVPGIADITIRRAEGAPCDLGTAVDIDKGNVTVVPSLVPNSISFGSFDFGEYKIVYVNGAIAGVFVPADPRWYPNINTGTVDFTVTYNSGVNFGDLPNSLGEPFNTQGLAEAAYAGQESFVFTQEQGVALGTIGIDQAGGIVIDSSGSPNPTWNLRKTREFVVAMPTRLQINVLDFADLQPALVACDGAANATTQNEWDGTFPVFNATAFSGGVQFLTDQSGPGLKINNKILDNFSKVTHDTAAQPTDTGCAWILSIDAASGNGVWMGYGGNGADPVGPYIFRTDLSGWSLCDQKSGVNAVTTAALPANTFAANALTASANGALPTIDSVVLVNGDRVLVKNETAAHNGIYDVTDVGSAGSPWILTRSADADTSGEVTQGIFVLVLGGVLNGDNYFRLTTLAPITLNTTGLDWTRIPRVLNIESY